MANSFTQLYIHAVFSVNKQVSRIPKTAKDRVHQYICGFIEKTKHKVYAINSMPDHVHLLISMSPDQSVSDLMREIKANSSRMINENRLIPGRFTWQTGFGAFSYSQSQISSVARYIARQEVHHKHKTFHEEYRELLEKFNIKYDRKYAFDLEE